MLCWPAWAWASLMRPSSELLLLLLLPSVHLPRGPALLLTG